MDENTTAAWRKSTYSNAQASCVEVGRAAGGVAVRDTKDRGNGPALSFPAGAWNRFTSALR